MKPRIFSTARLSFPLAAALAALLATHPAKAQTNRYWDGNNDTTGFGSASGTWAAPTTGTSTSGWSTSSTGGNVVLANSITTLINDPLHFGTDAAGNGLGGGTITVSGTVDAASLRFGSQTTSNVILSGGTINLAAVTSIHVGAGGTTIHNIASSITGAGTSLTKTGSTLTLSGANSYTGSTIISSGNLILNNLSALGSTSGINIGGASAATLSSSLTGITISAPITTANTGVTSTIAFGRGTANTGSIALNGAIGGNGNVAFTSPNANSGNNLQTINLGAAGTYAGSTSLNTGNINVALTLRNSSGAANVLPTSTVLTFGDGAGTTTSARTTTFDLNGQNQTLAGLGSLAAVAVPNGRNHRVSSTAAATLTINSTADQTFGGTTVAGTPTPFTTSAQIAGAISLVKNGAGTFTLGGLLTGVGATASGNSFTGSTTVLGGILVLGETISIQSSAFDTTASITGNTTNGLRTTVTTLTLGGLTGGNDFASRFTSTTGGYTGLTALTLNPVLGATHTYSGDIGNGNGNMSLTKSNGGIQVLSNTNSYTGGTTINQGTLRIGGINDYSAPSSIGAPASGNIVIGSANTGVLDYVGSGDSSNRTITVGSSTATHGGGASILANGGTALTFTATTFNTVQSAATVARTLTLGGAGIGAIDGKIRDNNTAGGGTVTVTKQDAGTWTLSGANEYTGATTIAAGTLKFGNNNVIANASAVTLGSATTAGTLDIAGFSDTIGTSAVATVLTLGTNSTTVGGLQNQVINSGGSAVLSVDGGIAYNAGTLGFNNGKALISANLQLGVTASVGRNLTVADSTATAVDLEITGVLSSGTNGITKEGTGTLFLNNDDNTATGQFIVNNGKVQVTKLANVGSNSSLGTGSGSSVIRLGDTLNPTLEYVGASDSSTNRRILLGTTGGGSTGATILNNGDGKLTFSDTTGFNNTNATTTARTLTLGGANTLGNTISGAIVDNTGTGGTVGVTKQDAGTWILDGDNTYKGNTTVTAGSLLINGNQSTATGAVAVSNTDTRLMGSGTVGGATTIQTGAIHSAGGATGAVGNQNFSSSLTYANGSIFEWDINANDTTTGFDTVAVTGDLNGATGGDTSIFRVVFGTTAKAGVNDSGNVFWNIESTSRVWSMTSLFGKEFTNGLFTSVQTYDSAGVFDVSSKGSFTVTGSSLTWTAVPEPTSALAGLLIAAGLLRRRRA